MRLNFRGVTQSELFPESVFQLFHG